MAKANYKFAGRAGLEVRMAFSAEVPDLPFSFHAIEDEELLRLVVGRRKSAMRHCNHVTPLNVDVVNRLRSTARFIQTLPRECDNRPYMNVSLVIKYSSHVVELLV